MRLAALEVNLIGRRLALNGSDSVMTPGGLGVLY